MMSPDQLIVGQAFVKAIRRVLPASALFALTLCRPVPAAVAQAAKPEQVRFTFAAMADPHCSDRGNPFHPAAGNGVAMYDTTIKKIMSLTGDRKPDFLLILGDIAVGAIQMQLRNPPLPIHVVHGNHVGTREAREQFRDLFPVDFTRDGKRCDYYSFVHKGVRFIGITDGGMHDHIGHLCGQVIQPRGQCEWLLQEFQKEEKRKILFGHVPPHPQGKDVNLYLSRNDSRFLNDAVKKHPLLAMFFGHQHRKTRSYLIGQTPCYVVASSARGRGPLGFLLVQVTGASLSTEFVVTWPAAGR